MVKAKIERKPAISPGQTPKKAKKPRKHGPDSVYTPPQWAAICDEYLESLNAPRGMRGTMQSFADKYGVSLSTFHKHAGERAKQVKAAAKAKFEAEQKIRDLPISVQGIAHNMSDNLKSMANHLAGAGNLGAATAHRLALLANQKIESLDPQKLDMEELREAVALQEGSNRAASTGLDIMRVMKGDTIPEEPKKPVSQVEYLEARAKLLNDV
jgi:hypothetical protein